MTKRKSTSKDTEPAKDKAQEQPEQPQGRGRPPKPEATVIEQKEALIRYLLEGKSTDRFCAEQHVGRWTLQKWLDEDIDLQGRFARAKAIYADVLHDKAIDIAADDREDYIEVNGRTLFNKQHVLRAKLLVDTILRVCAQLNPKKYGMRLDMTVDVTQHETLTDDQLNARMAQRLESIGLVPLLKGKGLAEEAIAEVVALFMVQPLPTAPPPPALPAPIKEEGAE